MRIQTSMHWNEDIKAFCAKWKHPQTGAWTNKRIPVDVASKPEHCGDAEGWLQSFAQGKVAGTPLTPRDAQTIRTLLPRWLRWKGLERSGHLNNWVLPRPLADIVIDDLSVSDCVAWIEWLQKQALAAYTRRNIVQVLRDFLVDCNGKGWVTLKSNPLLDPYIRRVMGKPERVAGANTIIFLDEAKTKTLLSCASPHIDDMRKVRYVLAIATGARQAEIAAWQWSDVDLTSKVPTIRIFKQLVRGVKKQDARFKDPKKNSHRIIPLHPLAVKALRWWRERTDASPDAPLFPTSTGSFNAIRPADHFRRDLAVAQLPVLFDGQHQFTFHALRRTFMSLLESKGVSRDHIGNLAGHGARGTGDRHYIGKNIDVFYKAIKKLPLPTDVPWLNSNVIALPKTRAA